MGRMARVFALALCFLFLAGGLFPAEPRHALVIGNGNYGELGTLRNAPNDATDMAGALANLGFEVQTLIDADVVSMQAAVVRFGQKLSGSVDSVGFFFYAGHGVQYNGSNYLIPAGANIGSAVFLRSLALAAQDVLDTMQAAGNRLNIVVLDACRDNPFKWARSGSRGLGQVSSQPPGSVIAYATSAGSVAGDGEGRNGIFTGELLKVMGEPGLEVSEWFRRTGQAVQDATAGKQIPAIYTQFFGTKVLLPGSSNDVAQTVPVTTPAPVVPVIQSPVSMNRAELFIESAPVETDVTMDGVSMGRTPLFLDNVVVGRLVVVEGRSGTMAVRVEHRVVEGLNRLSLVLKQEHGNLLVQTGEKQAELYLDGAYMGLVGSGLFQDVDAGAREVELRLPGRKAVQTVEVGANATTRVTPVFEGMLYEVALDAQGGRLSGAVAKQVRHGNAYGELPVPQRDGYSFGGWWTGPGGTGAQVLSTTVCALTAPQTLKARWNANTYTVRFDSQGGGVPSVASKSVVYAQPYGTLAAATRSGYVFGGWWTGPGGTGVMVESGTVVAAAGAQTLYAKWLSSHTVKFDSQGGSGVTPMTGVGHGTKIAVPAVPTRSGYALEGWYKESTLVNKWNFGTDAVVADLTLYAKWKSLYSIQMTLVEGGTFQMGSTSGETNEEPVHNVTVGSYYLSTYEVTQDLYEQVMGSNPSKWKGSRLPVERVTWYEAVAFCNALSRKDGLEEVYTISGTTVGCDWSKKGYRLPTEAEWEYAARGGKQSKGYTYAGSNTVRDVAWYADNSGSETHDVGTKKANELGLYDMSGNVWEWCWDWKGDYPASAQMNPRGPSSGSFRVLRGGGWSNGAECVRTALRSFIGPSARFIIVGFRVSAPVV